MFVTDELFYDFGVNLPRVLVGGKTGVLDHVKKLLIVTEMNIVADCGAGHISLHGENLTIRQLSEERIIVSGDIKIVEFYINKR
ncbi:MAG TPA: YabP/YqfC family sporulation protein [Anaerovoracaceae bacterium]|nr:YabP/YqfC family sporulation protein [Anaerovoracaceae bacterium]